MFFSWLGLEFRGVFNLASVVYHLRPSQVVSDFRFQISCFRIQISDFRFQISDFRIQVSDFRFQISDFKFQISDFRFHISDFRVQISDFWVQISDFRFQSSYFRFQISDSRFRGWGKGWGNQAPEARARGTRLQRLGEPSGRRWGNPAGPHMDTAY